MKYRLKCVTCGREAEPSPWSSTCPLCGSFKGTFDVVYPYGDLRRQFRYGIIDRRNRPVFESFRAIFPFEKLESLPPLPVGGTPFFKAPGISRLTGLANLWIKDDGRNPSASFKDRASAVAIAMAREAGASVIAAASTGNAASSLATLAASVGMPAVLFVPSNAPRPKLAQILIHGGMVIRLDCDYDTAFDLCQMACARFGWYNRNTAINPFTGEGKKSAAIEIAVSLGKAPDALVCPVGDGCIIGGLYKGLTDLLGLGLIDKMPRLYGIQAEGASPVVKAFEDGCGIIPVQTTSTVADSISVGYPRDGVKALRAVRNSGGAMLSVSDVEILDAQRLLATRGGVFAEPAAAAALAGLRKLAEMSTISNHETAVLLLTGHGLKDIDTALGERGADEEITRPDMEAVAEKIEFLFSKI